MLLRRFLLALAGRVRVDHRVFQEVAVLVQGNDLAAGAEAGVDGQHAAAAQRRLQQQAAQVAGENHDGMRLGFFGQLAADLPLQARQHQPGQRVVQHGPQEGGVRRLVGAVERQLFAVADHRRRLAARFRGRRGGAQQALGQRLGRRLLDVLGAEIQPRLEGVFLLGAVQGQDAVRRDLPQPFAEIEVILVLQPLPLRELLTLGRADLALLPQELPGHGPHVGGLGD